MADSADTFSDVILLKNCCNVRMSDFLSKHEIRKIDDQIKAEAVVDLNIFDNCFHFHVSTK